MKRCINQRAAKKRPGVGHARRGSLFHYYMMYLFLSGVLLTTAGLCIHSILDADRLDEIESAHLNTLLRLERQLRQDTQVASAAVTETGGLTVTLSDKSQAVWKVDQNVVTRETWQQQELHSSERFVFRRTTKALFIPPDDSKMISFVLVEPERTPSTDASGVTDGTRHSVQILLSGEAGQRSLGAKEKEPDDV